MNRFCIETGVGLIPWAPLYRGKLARPWNSGETLRSESSKNHPMLMRPGRGDETIVKRVEETAKKHGWTMSQVALAWNVQKQTIPIVGFSNLERVDDAVGVKGKRLSEEEMKYLEEPYEPREIMGHS